MDTQTHVRVVNIRDLRLGWHESLCPCVAFTWGHGQQAMQDNFSGQVKTNQETIEAECDLRTNSKLN